MRSAYLATERHTSSCGTLVGWSGGLPLRWCIVDDWLCRVPMLVRAFSGRLQWGRSGHRSSSCAVDGCVLCSVVNVICGCRVWLCCYWLHKCHLHTACTFFVSTYLGILQHTVGVGLPECVLLLAWCEYEDSDVDEILNLMLHVASRGRPTRRLSAALTRRPFFTSTDIESFHTDGFVVKENVLSAHDSEALSEHYHELFAGEFPTGIFPDEWHWREGLSLPEAVREIVNGWKASPVVARVALSPSLGHAAASLMRWSSGTRLAQDDVLWKPPGASGIGFHQDSACESAGPHTLVYRVAASSLS